MCDTRLSEMDLCCFVEGSTVVYPRSFRYRIRDLCPNASRVGSPQNCVQKDIDISNMVALTVPCRSSDLSVVPNIFIHTDDVNDNTRIILSPCGISSRNLFSMHVCVSNMHHL